jgi:hypothetical protein
MQILNPEYAAEVIMKDGDIIKFDHPICMVQYFSGARKAEHARVRCFFVTDYESKRWLPAESAVFVRGDFRTAVMDYPVLAVRDTQSAMKFCRLHRSELLRFKDLWTAYSEPDKYFRLIINKKVPKEVELFQVAKDDLVQLRVKNESAEQVRITLQGYDNVNFAVDPGKSVEQRFVVDKPGEWFELGDARRGVTFARLVVTGVHFEEEGKNNDEL